MRHILLADPQYITRVGIDSLLQQLQEVEAIHRIRSKANLTDALLLQPNALIVIDYLLLDRISVEDLLQIHARFPEAHWLLFSDELPMQDLKRLLSSNKSFSIVFKNCDEGEVQTAITHSLRNQRFICSAASNMLLQETAPTQHNANNLLTTTEKEILKEIALGKTTKEIANSRYISIHTINTHRKNIFRKLEVNTIHEATKYAMRAGIIDIAEYTI